MLFTLAHLHTFRPTITTHPIYVFFSLVDDTHIVGPKSYLVPSFLHCNKKIFALGISVQLTKCVVWFPHGLDCFISFPPGFFTPNVGFYILGAMIGSKSFVVKTLHEHLGTISLLEILGFATVACN
jgi:hypothetical protein